MQVGNHNLHQIIDIHGRGADGKVIRGCLAPLLVAVEVVKGGTCLICLFDYGASLIYGNIGFAFAHAFDAVVLCGTDKDAGDTRMVAEDVIGAASYDDA